MLYDRRGQPLTLYQWGEMMQDLDYKRVALFEDKTVTISTVWLGFDHSFVGGPPLIFETMIFRRDGEKLYDQSRWRYSTEEDALEGHQIIVAAYRENRDPRELWQRWREMKRRDEMI